MLHVRRARKCPDFQLGIGDDDVRAIVPSRGSQPRAHLGLQRVSRALFTAAPVTVEHDERVSEVGRERP